MNNCPCCNNSLTKIRYPIADGTNFQTKLQCFGCGWKSPNAIKKPDNFSELPLFNKELFESHLDIAADEARKKRYIKSNGTTVVIYEEYIKSEKWKNLSYQTRKNRDFTCQLCPNESSETHHITYDNLGIEKWYELLAVCHKCHEDIHGRSF